MVVPFLSIYTQKINSDLNYRKGNVLDIMKYPRLRIKTLIMYVNWFASSFMLYGITLNWQSLAGNSNNLSKHFNQYQFRIYTEVI